MQIILIICYNKGNDHQTVFFARKHSINQKVFVYVAGEEHATMTSSAKDFPLIVEIITHWTIEL